MKKRILTLSQILLAILILITCSGCVSPSTSHSKGPAFWRVTDSETGNIIYLLGSIHVADDSIYPMRDTIMDAYDSCDYLAVEIDMLSYTEDMEAQMDMAEYMIYTDGRTIVDEIDQDLVDEAVSILEDSDITLEIPISSLQTFKPSTWTSLLDSVAVEKAGLFSEKGVDMHFLELARKDEKTVLEIESIESQMKLLSNFSPEIQIYLFENSLQIEDMAESVTSLYEAWKSGDIDAILNGDSNEEVDEETKELLKDYNQEMLEERDKLMSNTAEDYLLDGKQVFYVVGAMHMIGETGIVQQLTALGYDVERL